MKIKVNSLFKKTELLKKYNIFFFYITSIFFLISSNTVYHSNNYIKVSVITTFVIGLLFLHLFKNKIFLPSYISLYLVIYIMYSLSYIVFKGNSSFLGVNILLIVFPLEFIIVNLLYKQKKIDLFFEVLLNCIFILASISLFFWLFGSILHILKPTGAVNLLWGDKKNNLIPSYYNIYFEPQKNDWSIFGIGLNVKNCSIFSEAPMSSYIYCIGILISEYILKKKEKRYIIMFILTILSVQSITGYLFLTAYIFCKIINNKCKNSTHRFMKYMLVLISFIISTIIISYFMNYKMSTGSGVTRSYMLMKEFKAFLHNPLLGNGFNMYSRGSSNSLTALLADGGILLWGLYYVPILGIIIFDFTKKREINYFTFLFTIVFMVTVVQYLAITMFIISLLWLAFLERIFSKSYILSCNKNLMENINDICYYTNI